VHKKFSFRFSIGLVKNWKVNTGKSYDEIGRDFDVNVEVYIELF